MQINSNNKLICKLMKNMKQHKMIRKTLNKKILQKKRNKFLHHHQLNCHMLIIFILYHKLMMRLSSRLMKVILHLRMKKKKVFLINLNRTVITSKQLTKPQAHQMILMEMKLMILQMKTRKQLSQKCKKT